MRKVYGFYIKIKKLTNTTNIIFNTLNLNNITHEIDHFNAQRSNRMNRQA